MTLKLARRPLLRTVLTSILVLAGCARSAIESEGEEDDAAYSSFEAGAEPGGDADVPVEEAGTPPALDAGASPTPDAGAPQLDAAQQDTGAGGSLDGAAGAPEAGVVDAAAMDAAALDAAALDAAADAAAPRDAAPVDAAPPVDTAPPAPKCTAGNYAGMFASSVFVELFGFPLFEIRLMGNISLSAAAQAGSDRFPIANGAITGADTDGNQVTATVTGSLNCTTGKVDDGRLSGKYLHPILGEILFDGAVAGTYTNTPPSANGTWQTETASTTLLKGAMGTWNVALQP
jgi:hypothetical protein